jgi:hypothetical protein
VPSECAREENAPHAFCFAPSLPGEGIPACIVMSPRDRCDSRAVFALDIEKSRDRDSFTVALVPREKRRGDDAACETYFLILSP